MEATVVCIDNSEWTRSGDYAPTRFQAQADAVNLLAGAKTEAHPENTVGVLTMAGRSPRVLVTPTPDLGKVLTAMGEVDIDGDANLSASVQIAQLALKHRQNKNQRQRVVLFIGSPIKEDKTLLVKIAKKLKKNNVAVDVVSFGCEEDNAEKLEAFIESVNSNGNSHLISVPPGCVLSDVLIESPVFQGEGGSSYGGAAGGGGDAQQFEFGVDPNIDPELALALRVSLEEERARQNAAAAAANASQPDAAGEAQTAAASAEPQGEGAMEVDPEDALLQQALAMSMQADRATADSGARPNTAEQQDVPDVDMDDDPELAMALRMSMQHHTEPPADKSGASGSVQQALGDPQYLSSVLSNLPGVNVEDPALQAAMKAIADDAGKKDKKDDGKDKEKKDG